MRGFLVLLAFCPLVVWADPPASDTLSVLRFNTVCANCHEGQCSGRLSFSLGPEATFSHIRRFAGEADAILVRQLQALLEYMKQECAYAPLPVPDMQGLLGREILDAYRDPENGNYFMPLGKLERGETAKGDRHKDQQHPEEYVAKQAPPVTHAVTSPLPGAGSARRSGRPPGN